MRIANRRVLGSSWLGSRLVLMVVLAGLLGAGLGCSSLQPLEPLGVNLVNLDVQEITLFEATLLAKVRVSNPNPDPVEFVGGSLKLLLDEHKMGTAMTSAGFAVPGFESTVVDMTVHVNTMSAIARLPELIEKKSVTFGVRGALYSQGSFGTKKHRVESSGSLDLGKLGEADREEAVPPPTS